MAEPVFWRLRTDNLHAPAALGRQELMVGAGKLLAVGSDLSVMAAALGALTIDAPGKIIPGLIDQHTHFTGGGDGDGALARMPELGFADYASAGVTTGVGLLGSEIEAKSLNQLLRKANELGRQGLTTFIHTGAMRLPPPFLTSSIRSDIVLLDKVIGAKSALAERIFPNMDFPALAALAGECLQAKANSGKASVLHLHVGRLKTGLESLFDLIERFDFPPAMAVPTHVNRSQALTPLFDHGLTFARAGGVIDFTCCLGPLDNLPVGMDVVEAVKRALDGGVGLANITLSSDSGVAVPDGAGGMRQVPPSILFRDVRRLVHEGGLTWEQALRPVTTNVAGVLGLEGRKGSLSAGADADMVFLDDDDRIAGVMAGGRIIHARPQILDTGSVAIRPGRINQQLKRKRKWTV